MSFIFVFSIDLQEVRYRKSNQILNNRPSDVSIDSKNSAINAHSKIKSKDFYRRGAERQRKAFYC